MNRLFSKFTSLILSGALLTAGLPANAYPAAVAAEQTGSVTVTVYDDTTGNPAANEMYFIISKTNEALSKSWLSFRVGSWNTAQDNPYTLTDIPLADGWFYEITAGTQTQDDFYYTMNADTSDLRFDFSASTEQNLEIHLTSMKKERFLVYRGTYGAEQYPLFEYYYPAPNAPTANRHTKVFYDGKIDEALTYGDILLLDADIQTTSDESYYAKRMEDDFTFTKSGTCATLFDCKTLTIDHIAPRNDAQMMEEDPRLAYSDAYLCLLSDDAGETYQYVVDYYDTASDMTLKNAKAGDTLTFAL